RNSDTIILMNRRYLGFLGFLGFLGVGPLLRGDWFGALWLLWFLWFLYFVPASPHPSPKAAERQSNILNDARTEARKSAVEKVFAEIQQKGSIRNDEVQALLGVSDATAERYLQELESEGRIVQVGEAGKTVSYRVT
ncbi:MAG: winged helix-turn-helix transcriptional regulator, partial [bacterium]|nr:winged helix-turn-helix transcriptional regulator [bacterium]